MNESQSGMSLKRREEDESAGSTGLSVPAPPLSGNEGPTESVMDGELSTQSPPPVHALDAEPKRGSIGRVLLIAIVALLLLAGVGVAAWPLVVEPMRQRMEEERIANLIWPNVQLDGVLGDGANGMAKAILSGEIVPEGSVSPDGVEVKTVEQGQVLLGFDGDEKWVLVGDRAF